MDLWAGVDLYCAYIVGMGWQLDGAIHPLHQLVLEAQSWLHGLHTARWACRWRALVTINPDPHRFIQDP